MPTKAEFEAAATKFEMAAQQAGDITAGAAGFGASAILRGGSLGRQVPARISQASVMAGQCQALIQAAAQTCLERAAIIAEYEVRLAAYDQALLQYEMAVQRWSARYNAWFTDTAGVVQDPGERPRPPRKPTPPPPWADVRRP